jgi:hypothetical protein
MSEITDQVAVKIRRRRPRFKTTATNRRHHAENWRSSGLSKTEYARKHNIPMSCLSKWVKDTEHARLTFKAAKVIQPSPLRYSAAEGVEIFVGQSVRVKITGICEPALIVGIVQGLTHAADH